MENKYSVYVGIYSNQIISGERFQASGKNGLEVMNLLEMALLKDHNKHGLKKGQTTFENIQETDKKINGKKIIFYGSQ